MALDETLRKVDGELADGDLSLALRRLHGLRSTYPRNIEIRMRLTEVYRALGEVAQAGRWGYLRRPRDPVEERERAAFEAWANAQRGGRWRAAARALELIRWPGPIDDVEDPEAREILTALRDDAKRGGRWVEFDARGQRVWHATRRQRITEAIGCAVLAVIPVVVVLAVLRWLVSAIAETLS